jgi:hypothetical protein
VRRPAGFLQLEGIDTTTPADGQRIDTVQRVVIDKISGKVGSQ